MKILLTGPNSFCGRVVLNLLLSRGHELTIISRKPVAQDIADKVRCIQGDLSKISCIDGDFDAVVHIAATSPTSGVTTDDLIQDNILATQNLIHQVKSCPIERFIFFSTCSVYGDVSQLTLTEKTPICNPCTYGASKLMGEAMLREQKEFKSLAIRLPAVIGNGAARHWLANTINKAQKNESIHIHNPHAIFNNVIDVYALAEFVEHLLCVKLNQHFDCINIASNEGLSIMNIVEKIKAKVCSNSAIKVEAVEKVSFTISNQYATETYGFKPQQFSVALDDYLHSF